MKGLIKQYMHRGRDWSTYEPEDVFEQQVMMASLATVHWRLELNNRVWKSFLFVGSSVTIHDVLPGMYRLILETGLEVWSGSIEHNDVITPSLELAAGRFGDEVAPAKQYSVLGLWFDVFAGHDSGHFTLHR